MKEGKLNTVEGKRKKHSRKQNILGINEIIIWDFPETDFNKSL